MRKDASDFAKDRYFNGYSNNLLLNQYVGIFGPLDNPWDKKEDS